MCKETKSYCITNKNSKNFCTYNVRYKKKRKRKKSNIILTFKNDIANVLAVITLFKIDFDR